VDASPGGEIPSSDLYRIGLVHDTTRYFNGDIDYVKVFNRALSAEEISIEYNTMVKNEVQFHDSGKVYAKKLKQY
jgi:5'-deoxynucleotidase YfbR-like HD superfamily hydrolase